MIKNFLEAEKQVQASSHGGTGPVDLFEIWSSTEFQSNIDFIDRVVVPPRSTIGYHAHGDNEEMYVILDGAAQMTIDGKDVRVRKGDMILNKAHGAHGLTNDTDADVDVLVIQMPVPTGT